MEALLKTFGYGEVPDYLMLPVIEVAHEKSRQTRKGHAGDWQADWLHERTEGPSEFYFRKAATLPHQGSVFGNWYEAVVRFRSFVFFKIWATVAKYSFRRSMSAANVLFIWQHVRDRIWFGFNQCAWEWWIQPKVEIPISDNLSIWAWRIWEIHWEIELNKCKHNNEEEC